MPACTALKPARTYPPLRQTKLYQTHTTNKNTANPCGKAVFGEAARLLLGSRLGGFRCDFFCRRLGFVTLDAQQFEFEYQYRVRRDQRARALLAVGQVAGDVQLVLLTDMHQLQAFDPARNHAADRQIDRATALDGAVEDGT